MNRFPFQFPGSPFVAGQDRTDGAGPQQPGASSPQQLLEQLLEMAASAAAFVRGGFQTVSADEFSARLTVCQSCPRQQEGICLECGCHVAFQAQLRCVTCPLGKWAARKAEQAAGAG